MQTRNLQLARSCYTCVVVKKINESMRLAFDPGSSSSLDVLFSFRPSNANQMHCAIVIISCTRVGRERESGIHLGVGNVAKIGLMAAGDAIWITQKYSAANCHNYTVDAMFMVHRRCIYKSLNAPASELSFTASEQACERARLQRGGKKLNNKSAQSKRNCSMFCSTLRCKRKSSACIIFAERLQL